MTIADHQKKYSEAIRQAKSAGADAFQSWFDKAASLEQSVLRGYWDMAIHILTPAICGHIENPESMTALEIGYGGGRLLNAACRFFGKAIGIDIHGEQEAVEEFLRSQGNTNFRLIRTSGSTIDVDSASVDFVYSFIVLQHLPSFAVLESYIRETARCLRKGGAAQLYFGKFPNALALSQLRHFLKGYKEIEAPVNHTSLIVRTAIVERLCKNSGLTVIGTGASYKRAPDGFPSVRGGQNCVSVVKE